MTPPTFTFDPVTGQVYCDRAVVLPMQAERFLTLYYELSQVLRDLGDEAELSRVTARFNQLYDCKVAQEAWTTARKAQPVSGFTTLGEAAKAAVSGLERKAS
jgi:hypothetical protein